jgi:hypothetical protein
MMAVGWHPTHQAIRAGKECRQQIQGRQKSRAPGTFIPLARGFSKTERNY